MSCLADERLGRKPGEPGFQQHMTMACFQNSAAPGGIKRGRCPPIASPRRDLALSFRQTVSAALTQYGGGQGMRDSGYFLEIIHRSEEHTSELQSLMRISYAVFCLKKQTTPKHHYIKSH